MAHSPGNEDAVLETEDAGSDARLIVVVPVVQSCNSVGLRNLARFLSAGREHVQEVVYNGRTMFFLPPLPHQGCAGAVQQIPGARVEEELDGSSPSFHDVMLRGVQSFTPQMY